jgi:hypothetical protein
MKHGIVTSTKITDDGHLSLVVQTERAGVTDEVVVAQSQPGSVQNIEEGYHVAFETCDDGLNICVGVLNTEPGQIPNSLNAREQSIKYDDGTEVSTRQNEDGTYNIKISSSKNVTVQSDNDLNISADSDVTINANANATVNANGNITIGKAANAVKLAVQNHTHNYSWTDSGGSGTTDPPNEEGTETAVE